jgi:hypothetical protein
MGEAAIDVEVVADLHTATGTWRYQLRATLASADIVKRSPWYTPALQEHLQLAHMEGPHAVKATLDRFRPDLLAWVNTLPHGLPEVVLVHAWGPRRSPHGPADDPGAP